MTLFVAADTSGAGLGNVFPMSAEVDLFSISHQDLGDGVHKGFGENPPDNNLIQVTYDRSDPGIPATRLDTLVNTNFGVNVNDVDVIIVAAGANFTLSDGTLTIGNGFTFPVGVTDNPTGSVLVVYDTSDNNGTGICVRKEGDGAGTFSIEEPENVILYHELSHAFHLANGDPLSSVASGCTASPEENRAETDENDMRDQLGLPHRDATDHCGNPGCQSSVSSCCIIASVASGSIYSETVKTLRNVRDGVLRCSECGFDFFNHLYEDYYAFSPEVCRLMARSPDLQELIRARFLVPLTTVLDLMQAHCIEQLSAEDLGLRFASRVTEAPELSRTSASDIDVALAIIGGDSAIETSTAIAAELGLLLRQRASPSPYVQWALMRPIAMILEALSWHLDGMTTRQIGSHLGMLFEDWATQMPLSSVWNSLSKYSLNEELGFLERTLLRTTESRRRFGQRLVEVLMADRAVLVGERWRG
ncbi:CFI-box-CTERM domain-containing protein [Silvibacterium acidisoli]|uniref:CFI-box-CTERM domain-containing protein n=1 Tax=Acidobacteriaceae bacterium ZG23-2 TaxID=2883246 RepID=UPI00406C1BFE